MNPSDSCEMAEQALWQCIMYGGASYPGHVIFGLMKVAYTLESRTRMRQSWKQYYDLLISISRWPISLNEQQRACFSLVQIRLYELLSK